MKSFRLFDKVLCNGEVRFVFGRCSSRYFDIPALSERKISAGISYKNPSLLEMNIKKEVAAIPLSSEDAGFLAASL